MSGWYQNTPRGHEAPAPPPNLTPASTAPGDRHVAGQRPGWQPAGAGDSTTRKHRKVKAS